MRECKPVSIPSAAFAFCKHTIFALMIASVVFKMKGLIVLCFAILALSALLKIERAPLVFLYTHTVEKLFSSRPEILDEHAMRFAHTLGAVLTGICLILLYSGFERAGWILAVVVTVAKGLGSLGYCSGVKLYGCLNNDNCCRFMRALK